MDDSNQPSPEVKKKARRESKTSKMNRRGSRKIENGLNLNRSPSISSRESFTVELAADSMSGLQSGTLSGEQSRQIVGGGSSKAGGQRVNVKEKRLAFSSLQTAAVAHTADPNATPRSSRQGDDEPSQPFSALTLDQGSKASPSPVGGRTRPTMPRSSTNAPEGEEQEGDRKYGKFNTAKARKLGSQKTKKKGLLDLIKRNQIQTAGLDAQVTEGSHEHAHGHGTPGDGHGHAHDGAAAPEEAGGSPAHGHHSHGQGHGPEASPPTPIQRTATAGSKKVQRLASRQAKLAASTKGGGRSPLTGSPRAPLDEDGSGEPQPGSDEGQSEDDLSHSSLDDDHEDAEALVKKNRDGLADTDAQAELQFNVMLNQLVQYCPSKLIAKDIFKFGVDAVTHKDNESDLNFTVGQFDAAYHKSEQVVSLIRADYEKQQEQNKLLMSSDMVFNFEKMQEHRQKMKELELTTEAKIADQKKLQKWLQGAIIQNIGEFRVHHKRLVYESVSLNLFKYDTEFRKMIVWLTEWKYFDRFIIFLICLGSVCQAMDSQVDYSLETERTQKTQQILNHVMNYSSYFFILEATMKIITQGLISHKNSYLRDGWNIVDFIIVLSSIFEIIIGILNTDDVPEFNYLRTLRVIRPLRSVKRLPSMRRLVTIMLRSLPELANTLVFMLFFFIVFGIVGIQTFHGFIYLRCRTTEFPVNGIWEKDVNQSHFICSQTPGTENSCREGTYCGSTVLYSQTNEETLDLMQDDPWADPLIIYNTVNFNNIGYAIMAIFEALTLEGWSIQMFMLMETSKTNAQIAIFFYLLLVIFGSYFILNLILAVIMGSFTKFENQEYENKMRLAEHVMLASVSNFVLDPKGAQKKNAENERASDIDQGQSPFQNTPNQDGTPKSALSKNQSSASKGITPKAVSQVQQKFDFVENGSNQMSNTEAKQEREGSPANSSMSQFSFTKQIKEAHSGLGENSAAGFKQTDERAKLAQLDENNVLQQTSSVSDSMESQSQLLKNRRIVISSEIRVTQLGRPLNYVSGQSSPQPMINAKEFQQFNKQLDDAQKAGTTPLKRQATKLETVNEKVLATKDNDEQVQSEKGNGGESKDLSQNANDFGKEEAHNSNRLGIRNSQKRNILYQSQQNRMGSKNSQNSILEISNEDDYSNDYNQDNSKQRMNFQKYGKNQNDYGVHDDHFDNFMEGGDDIQVASKVPIQTEDHLMSSVSVNPGQNTNDDPEPQSFTQLAVLQTQKAKTGSKKVASFEPVRNDEGTEKSKKESDLSPANSNNASATPKQENDMFKSIFAASQGKSGRIKKQKTLTVTKKLSKAMNGSLKMSSKKYAKTGIYSFFGFICNNKYFNLFILAIIALNTVTLSMDRYPISVKEASRLEEINKVTTWIFVGELVIKVLGLGLQTYVRDQMNQFDAVVVIISIVEIILSNQQLRQNSNVEEEEAASQENMSLTIFRGFRLLRVFRLFSKWKTFHKMIVKIGETLKDIITFFFLLLIIVFVFSLLGVELFKNKAKINRFNDIVDAEDPMGYSPRQNFDDFFSAAVSVFVCLIGEDWQLVMHDYVRAPKQMLNQLYFILLMIIGNLFLMNLFLAILLKNFEDKDGGSVEKEEEKEEEDIMTLNYLQKSLKLKFRKVFYKEANQKPPPVENKKPSRISLQRSQSESFNVNHADVSPISPHAHSNNNASPKNGTVGSDNHKQNQQETEFLNPSRAKSNRKDATLNQENSAEILFEGGGSPPRQMKRSRSSASIDGLKANDQSIASHHSATSSQKGRLSQSMKTNIAKSYITIMQKKRRQSKASNKLIESGKVVKLVGKSLFIFAEDNPFRVSLSKLVVHNLFEMFIFVIVILSAILMMLDGPLSDPDNFMMPIIDKTNLVITIIFMTELVLKVVAMGFILHKHSYMRDGWNVLDFVIVAFSIASMIVEGQSEDHAGNGAKTLELFKMLRVLRSLRMISKSEGLKLSVLSLIYSMPGILNVTIVSLLYLMLLGIFFLNLFKGKFYHCVLPDIINENIKVSQIVHQFDCVNYGGVWKNSQINFDDIGSALIALFVMCTTEGWVSFMNLANDSIGIGIQPIRNANPIYQYFFIIYMIFGSLFITNLFIEVVINTFDKEKKAIDRNDRLTTFQKEWIQLQLKCYDVSPEAKINTNFALRTYSIQIVENKYFDPFIMVVILLNAVALACVWVGISQSQLQYLETIQDIFNFIFILECILKLIAYQRLYFQSGWNKFDFVVVVGGIWGLLGAGISSLISVLRILRVARLLRLLKRAKRLYIIFNSFIHTIPAFINVGGLIAVIIYIAGVLGNRLFADIMLSGSLDKNKNFQTPGNSLMTLILVMTGEGWYEFMGDLQKQREVDFPCVQSPTYEDFKANDFQTIGCGSVVSTWFFVLYVVLVSLILVNLFIAVTLQGFNDVSSQDSCRITDQQIQVFINVWKELDPDGTGYIHISEAASLMRHLIEKKCDLFPSSAKDLVYDPKLLSELIEHLQLKLYKNFQYYNFHDILISLAQMYLQQLAQVEILEIFEEFKEVHQDCFEPEDLDDVIEKIEEIMQEKNVQLCRKLEKTMMQFKNNILGKIDRFEGNIYNSSMIPIVVKIQQIFREKRKQRALVEAEQEKQKKYVRQNLRKPKRLEAMDIPSDDEEDNDLAAFLRKKQTIATSIKEKLDAIMNGHVEREDDEGPTLQEMIDKQKELKRVIKKKEKQRKRMGRFMTVCNSRDEFSCWRKDDGNQSPMSPHSMLQVENQGSASSVEGAGNGVQTVKLENYVQMEPHQVKEALNLYLKYQSEKEANPNTQYGANVREGDSHEFPPIDHHKAIKIVETNSRSEDTGTLDSAERKGQAREKVEVLNLKSATEESSQDKGESIFMNSNKINPSDLRPFQNYNQYSRQIGNQMHNFEHTSFDHNDQINRASKQYSNIQSLQNSNNFQNHFDQENLQIPQKTNFHKRSNSYGESIATKNSKESQEPDSKLNPVTDSASPSGSIMQAGFHSFNDVTIKENPRASIEQPQLQVRDNLNLNLETTEITTPDQNTEQRQGMVSNSSVSQNRVRNANANNQAHKMRGGQPSQQSKSNMVSINDGRRESRSGQGSGRDFRQMVVSHQQISQESQDQIQRDTSRSLQQSVEDQQAVTLPNIGARYQLNTIDEQSTLEKNESSLNNVSPERARGLQRLHFEELKSNNPSITDNEIQPKLQVLEHGLSRQDPSPRTEASMKKPAGVSALLRENEEGTEWQK